MWLVIHEKRQRIISAPENRQRIISVPGNRQKLFFYTQKQVDSYFLEGFRGGMRKNLPLGVEICYVGVEILCPLPLERDRQKQVENIKNEYRCCKREHLNAKRDTQQSPTRQHALREKKFEQFFLCISRFRDTQDWNTPLNILLANNTVCGVVGLGFDRLGSSQDISISVRCTQFPYFQYFSQPPLQGPVEFLQRILQKIISQINWSHTQAWQ